MKQPIKIRWENCIWWSIFYNDLMCVVIIYVYSIHYIDEKYVSTLLSTDLNHIFQFHNQRTQIQCSTVIYQHHCTNLSIWTVQFAHLGLFSLWWWCWLMSLAHRWIIHRWTIRPFVDSSDLQCIRSYQPMTL